MVPPGGAPLTPEGLRQAFRAGRQGREEPGAQGALYALRRLIGARFGVRHVVLTGSGREALALLCAALRRREPQRNQVLVPAYVSFSVPSAVVRAGCRVALYDVDPASLAPCLESLDRALDAPAHQGRTLALVACHQFGLPFDLAPLAERCRRKGITLIDDAAQAMGASVNGRNAGCMGDAGMFSLSRSKPLTAVEGGLVISDQAELAEALSVSACAAGTGRNNGVLPWKALALALLRHPLLYRLPASLPWLGLGESVFDPDFGSPGFSAFQAGLAAWGLERLEAINASRRRKAELYREQLRALPWLRPIEPAAEARAIYTRFPVVPASGDGWKKAPPATRGSAACGVSRGFPLSLAEIPGLKPHLTPASLSLEATRGARWLARNLLTLPTHDQTTEQDCLAALACLRQAGQEGV